MSRNVATRSAGFLALSPPVGFRHVPVILVNLHTSSGWQCEKCAWVFVGRAMEMIALDHKCA